MKGVFNHFVLICPSYNEIRQKYIKRYFRQKPSMFKFIDLLNCQNQSDVIKLGKFIYEAFRIRNSIIN